MREPEFWDDAALEACVAIFSIPYDYKHQASVKELREYFDEMVNRYFNNNGPEQWLKEEIAGHWIMFATFAVRISEQRGKPLERESVVETLIRKQRDYGHENIRRFGRDGLLIRCHDKVARLENLCGSDFEPNNESIEDTLLDIVGYSAIGSMWEHEKFLLPLAPEKKFGELLENSLEVR